MPVPIILNKIAEGDNGSTISVILLDKQKYAGKQFSYKNQKAGIEHNILKHLVTFSDNNNIVKFLRKTELSGTGIGRTLVLELCDCNLDEYMRNLNMPPWQICDKPSLQLKDHFPNLSLKNICHQIANGLHYLHSTAKILHGDINPKAILLKRTENGSFVKISSFGLSKKVKHYNDEVVGGMPKDQSFCSDELLSGNKLTLSSDVFSCGVLFFWIFSERNLPFPAVKGNKDNRSKTSRELQFSLFQPVNGEENICLRDLLSKMISHDVKKRVQAIDVTFHPLFWSAEKKVDFYVAIANRQRALDKPDKLDKRIFDSFETPITPDNLPKPLLQTKKDLSGAKVCKDVARLMRLIRNLKTHILDTTTPDSIKQSLGVVDSGIDYNTFLNELTICYPKLLIHLYNGFQSKNLRGQFYPETVNVGANPCCSHVSTSASELDDIESTVLNIDDKLKALLQELKIAEIELYNWQLVVTYQSKEVYNNEENLKTPIRVVGPGFNVTASPGISEEMISLPENTNKSQKKLQTVLDSINRGIVFDFTQDLALKATRKTKLQVFVPTSTSWEKLEQGNEHQLFSFDDFLESHSSNEPIKVPEKIQISAGSDPTAHTPVLTMVLFSRVASCIAAHFVKPQNDGEVAISSDYRSGVSGSFETSNVFST